MKSLIRLTSVSLLVLFMIAPGALGDDGALEWRLETGGDFFLSSPAIGPDGTYYAACGDDKLYAVHPDGSLKWTFEAGDAPYSPSVGADGSIYFGSKDRYLYAINPDGSLKWKYAASNQIKTIPAIGPGGVVYIADKNGTLHAVNSDGTLKWKFYTNGKAAAVGADGTIYVASKRDEALYAVNPDGSMKWKFPVDNSLISPPAIDSDGTIYLGAYHRYRPYLDAVNPDGTLKWKVETGAAGDRSSPAIGSDGTIYYGTMGNDLFAVTREGAVKWVYEGGPADMGHPTIGSDGLIYVCSGAFLFAFNPDGTVRWRFEGSNSLHSAPAIGDDGTIVVGGFEDCLYGVESTAEGAADAPWPTFQRDFSHTANAGAAPAPSPGSSEDSCLTLGDDFSLPVSCIEYGDASFRFTLTLFSMDPIPVWELDVQTFETGSAPSSGDCLSLEDDLSFDVPRASYGDLRFRFRMIPYIQPELPTSLYWRLAPGSLTAAE